jgi:hypothetical protein
VAEARILQSSSPQLIKELGLLLLDICSIPYLSKDSEDFETSPRSLRIPNMRMVFASVVDPDSKRSLDPAPDSQS